MAGTLLVGGLTAASLAAASPETSGTAPAAPITLFTSATPGTSTVTVPPGVTELGVTAVGGAGAESGGEGGLGGPGAVVSADSVTVTPGETLTVTVGQDGSSGQGGTSAGGSGAGAGGNGGNYDSYEATEGGGGGGASAVYSGVTPLVVAGGGGGGGGMPGADGGAAGQAGVSSSPSGYCGGGAGAGTQSGPGAAGVCTGTVLPPEIPGSPGSGSTGGAGGAAGNPVRSRVAGGGGGGGGLFGGGGSRADGGGGGSSYPPADVTGLDATGKPSVTITYEFGVGTSQLPTAVPGTAYGPVTLQVVNAGVSTAPSTTKVVWARGTVVAPAKALPLGLLLSSTGVLSGTPRASLYPGTTSVVVKATETVTTLSSQGRVVHTKTAVQVAIPLVIG